MFDFFRKATKKQKKIYIAIAAVFVLVCLLIEILGRIPGVPFNGWDDVVYPDIPLIMLTTLDKKNDAKKVSMNNNTEKEPNDE